MKKIRLLSDLYALVDDEDYEKLSAFTWAAQWDDSTHSYRAMALCPTSSGASHKSMHRLVMSAPRGKIIDHKNRDTLDNQKENLRICTPAENAQNRSPNRGRKYKGVQKLISGYFAAYISAANKVHRLGRFTTEEGAAAAYNRAAKKIHGEFAALNDI